MRCSFLVLPQYCVGSSFFRFSFVLGGESSFSKIILALLDVTKRWRDFFVGSCISAVVSDAAGPVLTLLVVEWGDLGGFFLAKLVGCAGRAGKLSNFVVPFSTGCLFA